jgi:hypothetical protein
MTSLYHDLAHWWPLISAPEDYAEEAAFYRRELLARADGPCETMLELGSGGGNNASHLKARFRMTLVEPSAGMLAVSRALNPELEHVQGDMRTVRLDRTFDSVFVHDAVCYMTTEPDLRAAMTTAALHCRLGGVLLMAPDYVRETFRPGTDHGGHDGQGRSARYPRVDLGSRSRRHDLHRRLHPGASRLERRRPGRARPARRGPLPAKHLAPAAR